MRTLEECRRLGKSTPAQRPGAAAFSYSDFVFSPMAYRVERSKLHAHACRHRNSGAASASISIQGTTMDKKQAAAPDAIALLTQDHKNVKKMFDEYEALGDKAIASKKKLADTICEELIVHTKIEEEIFYPAVRAAIGDDDLMDEADVEHAGAKDLIAQIQSMEP